MDHIDLSGDLSDGGEECHHAAHTSTDPAPEDTVAIHTPAVTEARPAHHPGPNNSAPPQRRGGRKPKRPYARVPVCVDSLQKNAASARSTASAFREDLAEAARWSRKGRKTNGIGVFPGYLRVPGRPYGVGVWALKSFAKGKAILFPDGEWGPAELGAIPILGSERYEGWGLHMGVPHDCNSSLHVRSELAAQKPANAEMVQTGTLFLIRATKDITEGEEIVTKHNWLSGKHKVLSKIPEL